MSVVEAPVIRQTYSTVEISSIIYRKPIMSILAMAVEPMGRELCVCKGITWACVTPFIKTVESMPTLYTIIIFIAVVAIQAGTEGVAIASKAECIGRTW